MGRRVGAGDPTDPSSDEEHRYDHVYDNADRGSGRRGSSGRRLITRRVSNEHGNESTPSRPPLLPRSRTEPSTGERLVPGGEPVPEPEADSGAGAEVESLPLTPRAARAGGSSRGRASEQVATSSAAAAAEADGVMPMRKSRSVELLALKQGADPAERQGQRQQRRKDLARQRRDRDKHRKQARDEKVFRGLAADMAMTEVNSPREGLHETAVAPGGDAVVTPPSKVRYPDAQLKLSFVSIKRKLQKSLAQCQTSSDLYAQQRQQDNAKVAPDRKRGSEEFWLDLKTKVFDVDPVEALKYIRSARARVPLLVQAIMKFFVAPGHDQERSVDLILAEVAQAQALYQSSKNLVNTCREWKRNEEDLWRRIELFQLWKHVRSELHLFLASASETFRPQEDTYSGWVSVLARTPAKHRTAFARRWIERIVKAISDQEYGLSKRRKELSAVGLSDLGSDVGRAVLMVLRINNACVPGCTECNLLDHVGWLVNQTKLLLKFVFEANVRTWSSLLQNNEEFVALIRQLYTKYFELIQHEGWRLRRRVQFGAALHSFLLEHRQATFQAEMQFASELKHDLMELIGDSDEIFAIGLLELVSALLADGLEIVKGVGGAAAAGSLSAPTVMSVQNVLLGNLKFCKWVSSQVYLSGIYEILEPDALCQALRGTKHRLFRLPEPVRKKGPIYDFERQEKRDTVPVVLAVPEYMQDPKEITMLLHAWCSTNDDINGYVLVLEDHGGWTGFEELPTEKIFGLVPGHGLDSTLAFGLRSGCLHIVATSAFALRQQQQLFEKVSDHSCRLVAEQEATFRPARRLLEQCNSTALEIAHQQLEDVMSLHGLYSEEEQARCDLAFQYCDQASKLFLNFQQICELDQSASAAIEHFAQLVKAREDGAAAASLQWFSADDLSAPEGITVQNDNLQRFLTTANSRIFGKQDRSPSGSPRTDHATLRKRSQSSLLSPTSSTGAVSPSSSSPPRANGSGEGTASTRIYRSKSLRAPSSPVWPPGDQGHPDESGDTDRGINGTQEVEEQMGEDQEVAALNQLVRDSAMAMEQSQARQAERQQKANKSIDAHAHTAAGTGHLSDQQSDLEIESMAPPSPKNDDGDDETRHRKVGADALQALVDALTGTGSPAVHVSISSLNVLAANAVAHASPAWKSNLHGVLREHGWQAVVGSSSANASADLVVSAPAVPVAAAQGELEFGGGALDEQASARLAQDLGMLIQAFVPGSVPASATAHTVAANEASTHGEGRRTPRKGVSFKTAGIVVRAGVRMAHDGHSSSDGSPRWNSTDSVLTARVATRRPLFVQTKAASYLQYQPDPLEKRDTVLREEQVIGRVVDNAAAIDLEPHDLSTNMGGLGALQRGDGLQRLKTGGRDGGVSELPKDLAARFLRHDRITLFTTSHDFLQATVENCRYVKQLLQRISFQTDTTYHEIDTVEDYYSDIKSYFRSKSSPGDFLPQVFFGFKPFGGYQEMRNLESIGSLSTLCRELSSQKWIEIPFTAIEVKKDERGRAVKLGEGVSGAVYAGRWQGNDCAIKRFIRDKEKEAEFQAEMGMLQLLRHPHVVNFYGAVTEGVHPDLGNAMCIVTELCQTSIHGMLQKYGRTVKDATHGQKSGEPRLSFRHRIVYLLHAAKGLAFLHSKNIIHRDLKSLNLLLTKDKKVVVCDFALSRTTAQNLTHSGLGTPGWIAPEAWLGDPVTTRSDVYGFAMVMFELLTSDSPLSFARLASRNAELGLMYQICAENLRPPIRLHGQHTATDWDNLQQLEDFFCLAPASAPATPVAGASDADAGGGEDSNVSSSNSAGGGNALLRSYCGLMKKCWARDPRERPEFSGIVKLLINFTLTDEFKVQRPS